METFLIGIFALVVGAAFCFGGYRFFLVLLPIWGFFAGFSIGASAVATLFGGSFLSTATGWIVGFVLGLLFAVLAYMFYYVAVAILGASVGYVAGTGLMAWGGFAPGLATVLVGVLFAGVGVALIFILNAPKLLIIVLTALGGASMLIQGFLLLIGLIPLASLRYGIVGAFLTDSWLWSLVWIVIAVAGLVVQWSNTQRYVVSAEAYPF